VATNALTRRASKHAIDVTVLAARGDVCTSERKPGRGVIEIQPGPAISGRADRHRECQRQEHQHDNRQSHV